MILVDTSIWIDHLRSNQKPLVEALRTGLVLCHPFVIGELALGSLRDRAMVLAMLSELPQAAVAGTEEVLIFLEHHHLFGLGIGYIDAHLLASIRLTPNCQLWTRDRRLGDAADRLELRWHSG
ncbi:VapC toxin family PIN domain ribonuclease [Microvirga sp. SRT01]|jgi:predicted nucleic acid-binding protein|uniref:PIN domain-containing protein n=1 Tax=Sphingomonas longa TaxID=2778730 RepID=A0ABS2D4E1_9SPHN|nr:MULTISPECIES: PIN domain-containing protein [Alphaproteobacteria]MBM6575785.1 hypothetical protein [Sphingomonas sp. BT552]MBR7708832.1 VapC toxin family PIN domain ribonuclease [Microvirga sp. SRT01]